MLKQVEKTMLDRSLMPERSVLVGLSGGADSAVLLSVMSALSVKYGFGVYAAHVNHGLRGAAADADEIFSKGLAKELNIPFFVLHADVRAESERLGMSEELAGRRVRYDFFTRLAAENDIEYIATAHHKNDNAETILMNFMRGSGLKGLSGIPYRRGNIIRPMLDVTRAEIESYCRDNGISYVTDATNLETVYTRNKIRHILIPEIEKLFNPSFIGTVTKNAAIIADEEAFMDAEADKAYAAVICRGGADIKKLCALHRAQALRVIRKMTAKVCGIEDIPAEVTAAALDLAETGRTGAVCDITGNVWARIEYGRLIIEEKKQDCAGFCYELVPGRELYIPEMGCRILAEQCGELKKDGCEYFTPPPGCRIYVRSRRAGDKFNPRGMKGKKKVKDYMVDAKIPRVERSRIGLLTFDDDIAWIIGHRRDGRFDFDKSGIKISILWG